MARKNDLLLEIKNNILRSLFKYCQQEYYDQDHITLDVEFTYKDEILSFANFDVSVGILEIGMPATEDYPATSTIVEFRLNASDISVLQGSRGNELSNIKEALNSLLSESEGEILKERL